MNTSSEQGENGLPEVTEASLPDNTVFLDVREADEWAAGRAPHSIHIPLGQLPERLAEIPQDGTIFVCCRSGGRSGRAVEYLRAQGFDAVNLSGGMLDWFQKNRPMAHDGPGIPNVS